MNIKNTEIEILQGNILDVEVEAVVNAANSSLLMNAGLAAVLKKNGGQEIEDEALKQAPIAVGEAVWTTAGTLKAKYVIHAAAMGADLKTDEVKIRLACRNALARTVQLKVKSVVLPAMGCGAGGFPPIASAKIMAQEVLRHLRGETTLEKIVFCLADQPTFDIFQKHVQGYLAYMLHKMWEGPFITVDAIVEFSEGIVFIDRANPPFGLAFPGGFVDYGESLEDAVVREIKEETDLDLENLRQFHTYSSPQRDPRFHTIATTFIAAGKGTPKAGDDAQGVTVIPCSDLLNHTYAFDHKRVIEDYLRAKSTQA